MNLHQDTLFDNRYLLKKMLGQGGFSEVWLVEDTKVGKKRMALKVYAPGKGLDDDGVQLFSSEFELVYDINHTNLLRPSHFDVFNRSPYLVMPFCERGSANKLVGNLTEEQAWRFLHDVAAGLAHLHEQDPPIIHQDIKPDNVLIDNVGHFLITDFGISTKARSTLRKSVGDAKSGAGTIAYMGPERFGKTNEAIKASDIWALGSTLFEMMCEDPPFGDHGGLVQKGGAEIPNFYGEWSNELIEIVTRCLQPEPWNRPMARQIVEWTLEHFKGKKITFEEEKKLTCIKCAKTISANDKFCPYCGATQKKEKVSQLQKEGPPLPYDPKKKMIFGIAGGVMLLVIAATLFFVLSSKPEQKTIQTESINKSIGIKQPTEPVFTNDSTRKSMPEKKLEKPSSSPPAWLNEYNQYINRADASYRGQNYQSAKTDYTNAREVLLKNGDNSGRVTYVREKIDACNNAISQQARREEEERKTREEQARIARFNLYEIDDDDSKLGTNFLVVQKKSSRKYGIIDKNGVEVVNFEYVMLSPVELRDGCKALKRADNGLWDIFNPSGNRIAKNLNGVNDYKK